MSDYGYETDILIFYSPYSDPKWDGDPDRIEYLYGDFNKYLAGMGNPKFVPADIKDEWVSADEPRKLAITPLFTQEELLNGITHKTLDSQCALFWKAAVICESLPPFLEKLADLTHDRLDIIMRSTKDIDRLFLSIPDLQKYSEERKFYPSLYLVMHPKRTQ